MTKKIDLYWGSVSGIGTGNKWYKGTNLELLNNSGTTDIRIDKELCQMSVYHTGTGAMVAGFVLHITDETGADLTSSITSGTTDDAALEVLLNQWKDNVWLTDFRIVGTGADEMVVPVFDFAADTKRILKPGQKLYLIGLAQPSGAETTKALSYYVDNMLWYSAAAQ